MSQNCWGKCKKLFRWPIYNMNSVVKTKLSCNTYTHTLKTKASQQIQVIHLSWWLQHSDGGSWWWEPLIGEFSSSFGVKQFDYVNVVNDICSVTLEAWTHQGYIAKSDDKFNPFTFKISIITLFPTCINSFLEWKVFIVWYQKLDSFLLILITCLLSW